MSAVPTVLSSLLLSCKNSVHFTRKASADRGESSLIALLSRMLLAVLSAASFLSRLCLRLKRRGSFARSTDTHVVDNSGDAASGESDDITDSCFTEDSDRLPSC